MSNIVQGLVWNAEFPDPISKVIAVKLADWADDDGGSIYPALGTIARMTSTARSTVCKWQAAMEHCGLLRVCTRSPGGTREDTTERAFDLDLLRRLAPTKEGKGKTAIKHPPELKLVTTTIDRDSVDKAGNPKVVKVTVFVIDPYAPPVRVTDGSADATRPADGRVDDEHPSARRTAPVRQTDGTRPSDGPEPFKRTIIEPFHSPSPQRAEPDLPVRRERVRGGKVIAELLAEGVALHIVELLIQPLHVRCMRAKGIDDYPAFLRDLRDRIAERNDEVSTLERAQKLLSDDPVLGRNVFPQLPKLVEALDIAKRRVAEDRAAIDRKRKSEARRTAQVDDPAAAAHTEALRERCCLPSWSCS